MPRVRKDAVVVKQSLFEMKGPLLGVSPGGDEDVYHGAKMNQQTLTFHTQLHEWSEAQRISSLTAGQYRSFSAKQKKEFSLPARRIVQIEHWAKDVNRFYHPKTNGLTKNGCFMKIDVSKYNMTTSKSADIRNKSASTTVKPPTPVRRAVSARSVSARANTANTVRSTQKYFGRSSDIHSIHNQLLDTQFHYAAQRRDLYSAQSSTLKSAYSDSSKANVPASTQNGWAGPSKLDNNSLARYTPSVSDETDNSSAIETDISTDDNIGQAKSQPVITSRSWSNQMMNVISIDDCKLNCRYRPQTIKESRGMAINYEELDRKRDELRKKEKNNKLQDNDIDNQSSDAVTVQSDQSDVILCENGNTEHVQLHFEEPVDKVSYPKASSSENSQHNKKELDRSPNNQTSWRHSDSPDQESQEFQDLLKSRATNSSYGLITSLYSSSKDSKSTKLAKKKKRQSRVARISSAIDDVVQDRKVLNTMDRNFDVRTAQVGRTIVDKRDGSETFQRIHSHLRKHISEMLESKCSVQTRKYHEMRQKTVSNEGLS